MASVGAKPVVRRILIFFHVSKAMTHDEPDYRVAYTNAQRRLNQVSTQLESSNRENTILKRKLKDAESLSKRLAVKLLAMAISECGNALSVGDILDLEEILEGIE